MKLLLKIGFPHIAEELQKVKTSIIGRGELASENALFFVVK